MKPEKVAEFKFSFADIKGDLPYRAAISLTAGKEVWVSVEMKDGMSWAASTPTNDKVTYEVLPECQLKVSDGKGVPQETGNVKGGYLPETNPGGYAHSFPHNQIQPFGTMAGCFETSYMDVRFIPIETGQYSIEFQHKRLAEQEGFGEYKILVHQNK